MIIFELTLKRKRVQRYK